MRHTLSALCFIGLCLTASAIGQEDRRVGSNQAVIVPYDIILPVILSQPDCPLQIERVLIVKFLDGRGEELYQVRNRGTQPIRSYTLAEWNSANNGYTTDWPTQPTNDLLLPGRSVPQNSFGQQLEFVNLTDGLRDRLRLRDSMRGIKVFMILRVEFADGTTYNDEQTYRALQNQFRSLNSRSSR